MSDFSIEQACSQCGRIVMHDRDGRAQPHYKPTTGRARCVPRGSDRPTPEA